METVSLLRVESYGKELPSDVARLLEPLGGIQAFCHRGDKVLLKPNFIMARSAESAATTHPAIIITMSKLLKDIGCEVAVGDSPGLGSATGVANKLGLSSELKRYGVKVIELETVAPVDLTRSRPFDRRFKNLQLAKEIGDYDRLINLAKLKTHGQMGLTLATKNLYGCVPGHNKAQWHFAIGNDPETFARLLLEIAFSANACLHIIDGIIGMDGNGPSNGRPRRIGLLLAGANPLAVDRVVVELIGQKPDYFPIFKAAAALDIPGGKLEEITVRGDPLDTCGIADFQVPSLRGLNLFKNAAVNKVLGGLIRQRLELDEKLCTKCRRCETQCPAGAITFREKIRIADQQCIRCCCCQEMCPVGALSVSTPLAVRALRKLGLM